MVLSAPLLTRKRWLEVEIETEKGTRNTSPSPSAILAFDLEINPTAPFEERKGTGLYRGHSNIGVLGERSGTCKFSTELRSNGTSGLDAGLAILLQACGFAKTSESYQVHSTHADDETISIDVWEDGVEKSLLGASGNVTFEGENGGRMMCNFEFLGVWQAPFDEPTAPTTEPGTGAPILMQSGTFTLDDSINISKFSLNMGTNPIPRYDVDAAGGIAYYMITDYDSVLSIDPEADLVAGYDYYGKWLIGTEAAVSLLLTDGTVSVTFTLPKVQFREIAEGDRDGIQIYDLTGQCNHSSGNDAVTIAASA